MFKGYISRITAQSYFNAPKFAMATSACGSACGAGDDTKKEEPKSSACGSACGASN